jgi:uncharacterized protein (DUF697 family)
MNILTDLGTDLAFAFLVEKIYGQRIDPAEAVALISQVQSILEPVSGFQGDNPPQPFIERPTSVTAH